MMGASRSRSQLSGPAGTEAEDVSLSEPLLDCAAAAALLNVRVSWVRDATRGEGWSWAYWRCVAWR